MRRAVGLMAFRLGLLMCGGSALVCSTGPLLAQASAHVPGSPPLTSGIQIARPPDVDAAAYDAVDSKIRAFEAIHGERVYLVGRPTDALLLPDGTLGYVLEWPPAEAGDDSRASWVVVAHPVRDGFSTVIDPVTGERVAVGTDPDGTYYGFAWFMETLPDVVRSGDSSLPASLYETHPPDIERLYAERARFSDSMRAAVQRWWADQDEWTESLRAADLVAHRGVISGCRETDDATVVTVKGEGTFEFVYRDHDRVTYEGAAASSPCELAGQTVVVWTLDCGDDDGPCIRRIEATGGAAAAPRDSVAEARAPADEPVPHGGVISGCRETDGATVVTLKGDGTFQFLHRKRDRVDYDGVQASSPCDLVGKKVVVWTVDCGEDSPCISSVQLVGGP
jgi:hypothetical protein